MSIIFKDSNNDDDDDNNNSDNNKNDLNENAHGRPRLDRYKLLSGTICVHRQVPQDLHQVTDQENGTKPLSGNGA